MRKLMAGVAAATLLISSAATMTTASADPGDRGVGRMKHERHYNHRGNHHRGHSDRYYRHRYGGWDNDNDNWGAAAATAGVIGAAAGVIAGSALSSSRTTVVGTVPATSSHVQRCAANYRSYDPSTDTYVTYGGEVRRCPL
ncbi:hypothetical protein DLJ53_01885 [Acuticoccus sediminis]|uniref:Lectin-like protein BA14k n=1 Tax=Acuticoccus sediminis TaxID=2184697 RepID=A0A8B2P012_9HYPH|nr:BA14K family protein [Acuticoccus sediminis]RAI03294.1 hypothetical protein DLJ53_01885 [Acuticoccus sediminis]